MYHIYSTQNIYEGTCDSEHLKRLYPLCPVYSNAHICEGDTPPKRTCLFHSAIAPAPMISPHLGCQPHRLLAHPESSLSQCSLPPRHWSSRLLSTLVLRDSSGIKGMGILGVIILTISIINLVLGQDPLIPTNHSNTI